MRGRELALDVWAIDDATQCSMISPYVCQDLGDPGAAPAANGMIAVSSQDLDETDRMRSGFRGTGTCGDASFLPYSVVRWPYLVWRAPNRTCPLSRCWCRDLQKALKIGSWLSVRACGKPALPRASTSRLPHVTPTECSTDCLGLRLNSLLSSRASSLLRPPPRWSRIGFCPTCPWSSHRMPPTPSKQGFAESYVHPGGHATGNVMNAVGGEQALTGKRFNFFRELVPDLKALGFVGSSSILAAEELNALQSVAAQLGFEIVRHELRGLDDVEPAVSASIRDGVGALYISGEPLLYTNMGRVLPLVMAPGKPTVGTYPEWGRAGLLMSYSADLIDDFRRAGIYAAKILGGEKPANLPIEQASKFVLVLNLRTAKALGITAPDRLLAVADEVID